MGGRRSHSDDDRARGKRLGAALAAARQSLGLTQQELATDASMALSTLRSLESGRTADPGFFTVARLARALNISVDDLLSASEQVEPNDA